MHARAAQYLNEIISLLFMGLMILALVAGQAAATPQATVIRDIQSEPAEQIIDVDFSIRQKGE